MRTIILCMCLTSHQTAHQKFDAKSLYIIILSSLSILAHLAIWIIASY